MHSIDFKLSLKQIKLPFNYFFHGIEKSSKTFIRCLADGYLH